MKVYCYDLEKLLFLLARTASRNRVTTPAPVSLSLELGLLMDKFGLSVDALGSCPAHGSV